MPLMDILEAIKDIAEFFQGWDSLDAFSSKNKNAHLKPNQINVKRRKRLNYLRAKYGVTGGNTSSMQTPSSGNNSTS